MMEVHAPTEGADNAHGSAVAIAVPNGRTHPSLSVSLSLLVRLGYLRRQAHRSGMHTLSATVLFVSGAHLRSVAPDGGPARKMIASVKRVGEVVVRTLCGSMDTLSEIGPYIERLDPFPREPVRFALASLTGSQENGQSVQYNRHSDVAGHGPFSPVHGSSETHLWVVIDVSARQY